MGNKAFLVMYQYYEDVHIDDVYTDERLAKARVEELNSKCKKDAYWDLEEVNLVN